MSDDTISWRMVTCPICGIESEEPTNKLSMRCSGCNSTVIIEDADSPDANPRG